jgi:hypothetical protein
MMSFPRLLPRAASFLCRGVLPLLLRVDERSDFAYLRLHAGGHGYADPAAECGNGGHETHVALVAEGGFLSPKTTRASFSEGLILPSAPIPRRAG